MKVSEKHIEARALIRKMQKGISRPPTTGEKNGMSKACCVDGKLYGCKNTAVESTKWTNRVLKRILNNPDTPFTKVSVTKNIEKGAKIDWIGKTPREVGFYYID